MAAAKKSFTVNLPWARTTKGGMQLFAFSKDDKTAEKAELTNVYLTTSADFPAGGSVDVTVTHKP
jgi:hypothetical protein